MSRMDLDNVDVNTGSTRISESRAVNLECVVEPAIMVVPGLLGRRDVNLTWKLTRGEIFREWQPRPSPQPSSLTHDTRDLLWSQRLAFSLLRRTIECPALTKTH
jgi:hypothetical protein